MNVDVCPRPVESLSRHGFSWDYDSVFSEVLGWAPETRTVRGAYSVEAVENEDGEPSFVAHGWIDLDIDGIPAHWIATPDSEPTRVTPPNVR